MAKTRAPYSPEFRRQMVDLVRSGRDPDDLAREYEPTAQSIRNWVASVGGRTGERPAKTLATADADELVRLRREVRQLRQECDILSKAAAWVSRGRPALCRPGLRVHERASGQLPDHGHGQGARGLDGGVLRMAQAAAVRTSRG